MSCLRLRPVIVTLTTAARPFGLGPTAISTRERGLRRDDELGSAYRDRLNAALLFGADDSLIDRGGLQRSGQERPVPAIGKLLPEVPVPAR